MPLKSSRSTWACELKYQCTLWNYSWQKSRSTWACELKFGKSIEFDGVYPVTLHVSVWVEIFVFAVIKGASLSRSTWACELKSVEWFLDNQEKAVTLHVSVWVEISCSFVKPLAKWSRSTWACELKWKSRIGRVAELGHAPRERVSWNKTRTVNNLIAESHAPRERVSWNVISSNICQPKIVTLHVSVWVEMLAW